MTRLLLVFLCLVALSVGAFAQRPGDVVATSRSRTIRVSDLSPATVAAVADAPTKRIALRQLLFDRFIYERLLLLESKAMRVAVEKIESAETARIPNPTPEEIKSVYEANRERLGDVTLAQARTQIIAFLRSEREQQALDRLASRLRLKYKYRQGKNVNASPLAATDTVAMLAGKPVAAEEFDKYARVELHEYDASLADRILFDLERTLLGFLIADEAAAEKLEPGALIAREVTNNLKEFSDEETAALEEAFAARLKTKYEAKILFTPPPQLIQDISADDDPSIGPPKAPITVVMFSDFQCSACRSTHPILKKIMAEFPGKIRFVVRDYPLENIHENALAAAAAANAAHAQGKFFEYIELLYTNQEALDAKSLVTYANQIGLDLKKFELDSKAASVAVEIKKDRADGRSYGVDATPTIFVNGIKVRDISARGIRFALSSALAK